MNKNKYVLPKKFLFANKNCLDYVDFFHVTITTGY